MALALNTGHPLYADLKFLACVDDDGTTILDLVGDYTLTPHADVTTGAGTYGRHFVTSLASNLARGVAVSPTVVTKTVGEPDCTWFIVANQIVSSIARGGMTAGTGINISVYNGHIGAQSATSLSPFEGTTNIVGTGAHSFAVTSLAQTESRAYVDGVLEATHPSGIQAVGQTNGVFYVGGRETGGYGGAAGQYVWVACFKRVLTAQEIADLHASLGADNTFALVGSGPVAAITLSPDPASVLAGDTATITISRNTVADGAITYNLTSSATGVATVPATAIIANGQSSTTFSATGVAAGTATLTATNAANSNESDTVTLTVAAVKKLRIVVHADFIGMTNVRGIVLAAGSGGNDTSGWIGEFSVAGPFVNAAGDARLDVPVSAFGGDALTTSDAPLVTFKGTTAAGSALGASVAAGLSYAHACTVVQE